MNKDYWKIGEFKGLDNKHPPEALTTFSKGVGSQSNRTGASYASVATNIDFTTSGFRRRQGFSLSVSGSFHSLWSNGKKNLCVKDGYLCLFDDSLNFTQLIPASEREFQYADTGAGIYLSDGQTALVVHEDAEVIGRAGHYQIFISTLHETGLEYDAMPPGDVLAWMFGRLFVSNGVGVYYSRAYKPNEFRLSDDYLDMPDVTMLAPVPDGIYIGTEDKVWFMSGGNPKAPAVTRIVSDTGAYKGTAKIVSGKFFRQGLPGEVVIWDGPRGKVVGSGSGTVEFLTEDFVGYPNAVAGASLVREKNGEIHHLTVLRNPSGEGSNMRTTDTAEAEVRRNGIII